MDATVGLAAAGADEQESPRRWEGGREVSRAGRVSGDGPSKPAVKTSSRQVFFVFSDGQILKNRARSCFLHSIYRSTLQNNKGWRGLYELIWNVALRGKQVGVNMQKQDPECPEGVSNITSLLSDIFNMNLPTIKVYDLYTE